MKDGQSVGGDTTSSTSKYLEFIIIMMIVHWQVTTTSSSYATASATSTFRLGVGSLSARLGVGVRPGVRIQQAVAQCTSLNRTVQSPACDLSSYTRKNEAERTPSSARVSHSKPRHRKKMGSWTIMPT